MNQTYYEILEVSPKAGQHEIHAAYRKAKSTYSTDSPALYTMFTREEALELLNLVEEAFNVLSNHERRKHYDLKLNSKGLPDFPEPTESKKVISPKKPKKSEPVPDGFSKTRLSVYKLDDDLESEILAACEFTGPFLQQIRKYKNISIEQMSKETKVSKSYIASIESEDYHGLPAPVFIRGFVSHLARTLGLNEKNVAASYMDRFKKATIE